MAERRRVKRRYLMYSTRVFDAHTGALLGNLVDITEIGVMITGEAPIPADTTFRLQIELTDDVADQPHLEVQARSLWSEPDIVPRFYTTGFELVTVQMGSTK